ncbi:MAG: DegT/DnrJ/EryC1/StrS aminotransferase [Sphingomonas sp.]|nr:DegT/DnrJ/EryC1/StrS aminotransferase [Sphingomonas sp.]
MDDTRMYSNFGPLATELERRLAERLGIDAQGLVSVANATVGLAATLSEIGRPGRNLCLLPSWTFCASAHAVLQSGLQPFFVDVDPLTWQLSPAALLALPAEVLDRAAAAMIVGAFGAPVNPLAWDSFGARSGIPVVIDAAAGFDSVVASTVPTVVSLHATKSLPAGEGGFVATADPELGRAIRQRINFGFAGSRTAEVAGMNGKLSEYTAAVGLASLDRWPASRGTWSRLRDGYDKRMRYARPVWFSGGTAQQAWVTATFVLAVPAPVTTIAEELKAAGIDTRRWWQAGCHREPAFEHCGRTDLAATECLAESALGLPFFPDLTEAHMDAVVAELVKHIGPDQQCEAGAVYPSGDRS